MVKAYDGYGDADDVLVYGHVLAMSPLPRKKYRQLIAYNFYSLIGLFMVRPVPHARVIIEWNGETRETSSDREGLFMFEWKPLNPVKPGWSIAKLTYVSGSSHSAVASAECSVFVPYNSQYHFVSDIDDTFLISHSSHLGKRLKLLFTRNARSREPFSDVVNHYRALSLSGASEAMPNPFFYVSSSEWNLYDYIREFCRTQGLPRGVFLLAQMRRLRDFLKTGQGRHATKYVRIARILKSFPAHRYVLLGDDTQEDPFIYSAIVRDFPGMVKWVYLRNVAGARKHEVEKEVSAMTSAGVNCCYFIQSSEAIAHSRKTGLIHD